MKLCPAVLLVPLALMAGCSRSPAPAAAPGPVIAVENFLADITRPVAGTRLEVRSLAWTRTDTSPPRRTLRPWPVPG